MILNWGFLCCGKICADFASAILTLDSVEHNLLAVAGSNLLKAQEFAMEFGFKRAYGSYEELVRNKNIDIVYVGSINPFHFPHTKLALENGKNVLCEIPMGINATETRELVTLARSKELFLMEALWTRCFPLYETLKEELDSGFLGHIKQTFSSVGIPLTPNGVTDRIGFKESGKGSILEAGQCCVQFATFVFGFEKPLQIVTRGHLNEGLVDESSSTTLMFSGGRTATFITHYGVELPCKAYAFGTQGSVKLCSPFCAPSKLKTSTKTIESKLPSSSRKFNFPYSVGLCFEAEEVLSCLKKGLKESPKIQCNESIAIAEILDSMREQVGVTYTQDQQF